MTPLEEEEKMEENRIGGQPHWKTNSMQDDCNGRWYQWMITSMEDDLNESIIQ